MLNFSLFGVPIRVEGWFWVSCVLLGGGISAKTTDDWIEVAIWAWVVLISIIVHEMGHALAGRRYGATPAVQLHGLGGLTYLPGAQFTRVQSILVSAAGPAAGILLGFLTLAIYQFSSESWPPLLSVLLRYSLWVNFFWSFINLLPILPMDGGQILRDVLGPGRQRVTSIIGCVLGAALAAYAASIGMIFLALMLAFFAYANFQNSAGPGGVVKS